MTREEAMSYFNNATGLEEAEEAICILLALDIAEAIEKRKKDQQTIRSC